MLFISLLASFMQQTLLNVDHLANTKFTKLEETVALRKSNKYKTKILKIEPEVLHTF